MSEPEDDLAPLTLALEQARSGLRRDVQGIVERLDDGQLLIPLKQPLDGVEVGREQPLEQLEGGELSLSPHLLVNEDNKLYAALFSEPDALEPVAEQLAWTTGEDALEVCALPARVAFEVALELVDDENVLGAVVNPGSSAELVLRRDELASLVAGEALPLVGYVGAIPAEELERTLLAEGEPPPRALVSALERSVATSPLLTGFEVLRTFNPDRDREPHLTVRLATVGDVDREQIAREVIERIQHAVPPPGYLDIIFQDAE